MKIYLTVFIFINFEFNEWNNKTVHGYAVVSEIKVQ